MKTIKVMPTTYNIKSLYRNAISCEQRELLGYMIKTGRTDNSILGGAFHLLGELDKISKTETYAFSWEEENDATDIISIAEAARARAFKKFGISKREVRKINKNIKNLLED